MLSLLSFRVQGTGHSQRGSPPLLTFGKSLNSGVSSFSSNAWPAQVVDVIPYGKVRPKWIKGVSIFRPVAVASSGKINENVVFCDILGMRDEYQYHTAANDWSE